MRKLFALALVASACLIFVIPGRTSDSPLIISEFRLRGPSGAFDEFVEIYNNTDTDHIVATTDGSAGYALAASDGIARFVIPNGTIIPARGHFLGVNSLGYSLAGSVLFFAVTSFGAWLGSAGFYPQTAAGLGAAYVAGIPFFQWTVLGTLAYAAILFGGFALLRRRVPALRAQTA